MPACELVSLTLILDDTDYDPPVEGRLAVSEDGEQIWLNRDHASGALDMVAFDNPGGGIVAQTQSFPDPVELVDMAAAHESGSEGETWTLHENGWRARWGTNGLPNAVVLPTNIEDTFPEGERQWCGFAMGLDGAAYVVAGHEVGAYTHYHLYREKDGVVTRTEGPFTVHVCPKIAYDLALDEVAVALNGGLGARDVHWFDPQTMDETHSVETYVAPQAIAAFNHKVALGTTSFIRVLDTDGSVTDIEWGISVEDLDVQYGDNMVRLWWSGLGPSNSTVGWFRLD